MLFPVPFILHSFPEVPGVIVQVYVEPGVAVTKYGSFPLKTVCDGINKVLNPEMSAIIITHYKRMLEYVKPQFVHIMMNGKIVKEGAGELIDYIDENGYKWIEQELLVESSK